MGGWVLLGEVVVLVPLPVSPVEVQFFLSDLVFDPMVLYVGF